MSDILKQQRRRWLYIDPSRSKKKRGDHQRNNHNRVKTSASFSHIYPTIAENAVTTNDEPTDSSYHGDHKRGLGESSAECSDYKNARHRAVPSNGAFNNHSWNSVSGNQNTNISGQSSSGKTVIQSDNTSAELVKNGGSRHGSSLLRPPANTRVQENHHSVPENEVSEVSNGGRGRITAAEKGSDKQGGSFLPPPLKNTEVVQNHHSVSVNEVKEVSESGRGTVFAEKGSDNRGNHVKHHQTATESGALSSSNGFTNTERQAGGGYSRSYHHNTAAGIRKDNPGEVRQNGRTLWSNKGEADHEKIPRSSVDNRTKAALVIANHSVVQNESESDSGGLVHRRDQNQTPSSSSNSSIIGNGGKTITKKTVEESSGKDNGCNYIAGSLSGSTGDYDELDNLVVVENTVVASVRGQIKADDCPAGHRSSDTDSDGEQASSEYVEYFVHCNGTVIKQKNSSTSSSNKDQLKPDRSGSSSGYYSSHDGLHLNQIEPDTGGERSSSYSSQTNNSGSSSGPNNSALVPLEWSLSKPPEQQRHYRLSGDRQFSSSTSDMLQRLEPPKHGPELDTMSVTADPEKKSLLKSHKLKSLFKKSHSGRGEQQQNSSGRRLNKHISWGTINEHFDFDYPIVKQPPSNDYGTRDNDVDDEVFFTTASRGYYPKKSMSLNLTPGFLDDKTAVINTHYNLESPTSIGSASSLMMQHQSEEDGSFSSCLDTLSNRSLDYSDDQQQDSVLDTLSNHSWCSGSDNQNQLDSSGCFTSSSLSQFSDYADPSTNKKQNQRPQTTSMDPRQTKSNLDLVEIMSTFSDILDVSLESLQSQKLQGDRYYNNTTSSQWDDTRSHSGLVAGGDYSQNGCQRRRRMTPAVSFGCETELQKQCNPFEQQRRRLTSAQSMNLYCPNAGQNCRDATDRRDQFSVDCDSLLGIGSGGLQRSDSTETITEEMVSDLQTQSDHLRDTIQELDNLSNQHSSNDEYQLQQRQKLVGHTRTASLGEDSSHSVCNNNYMYSRSGFGGGSSIKQPNNADTSRSCYELSQGTESMDGTRRIVSSSDSTGQRRTTATTGLCDRRDIKYSLLTPEGPARQEKEGEYNWHQQKQHVPLSAVHTNGGVRSSSPEVCVGAGFSTNNSSSSSRPRLMHSTSLASGLASNTAPMGDYWCSSLEEALSELDPQLSFSHRVINGRDTEPSLSGRDQALSAACCNNNSQEKEEGRFNGSVTSTIELHAKCNKEEAVKRDGDNNPRSSAPIIKSSSLSGLSGSNRGSRLSSSTEYDNRGYNKDNKSSGGDPLDGSVVSAMCVELNNNNTTSSSLGESSRRLLSSIGGGGATTDNSTTRVDHRPPESQSIRVVQSGNNLQNGILIDQQNQNSATVQSSDIVAKHGVVSDPNGTTRRGCGSATEAADTSAESDKANNHGNSNKSCNYKAKPEEDHGDCSSTSATVQVTQQHLANVTSLNQTSTTVCSGYQQHVAADDRDTNITTKGATRLIRTELVNIQLSSPSVVPPKPTGPTKVTARLQAFDNGHHSSSGNSDRSGSDSSKDSMSLATLLRIRTETVPSHSTANKNSNGMRKFSLSDIKERSASKESSKAEETGDGSTNTDVMSPEEQQELDLLLQSLVYGGK